MTNFIPIFPLSIVVYPGETLNLHIFEDRYKQLVKESIDSKKPFGIPAVIDNGVADLGTSVAVINVAKEYEDGKMDITVQGLQVFRILEVLLGLGIAIGVGWDIADGWRKAVRERRVARV